MSELSFQELTGKSPAEVETVVSRLLAADDLPDFTWVALADTCEVRSRTALQIDRHASLLWARIAVLIADRLSPIVESAWRHSIERNAMRLRSDMILLVGPKAGDSVLDPRIVEDWFYSRCDMSIAELAAWQDDVGGNASGRSAYFLERYFILLPLYEKGIVVRNSEFAEWKRIVRS